MKIKTRKQFGSENILYSYKVVDETITRIKSYLGFEEALKKINTQCAIRKVFFLGLSYENKNGEHPGLISILCIK